MLSDYERSPLYVFYDDNQNIYSRVSTFPIRQAPFTLTTNCQNTAPISIAPRTPTTGASRFVRPTSTGTTYGSMRPLHATPNSPRSWRASST